MSIKNGQNYIIFWLIKVLSTSETSLLCKPNVLVLGTVTGGDCPEPEFARFRENAAVGAGGDGGRSVGRRGGASRSGMVFYV